MYVPVFTPKDKSVEFVFLDTKLTSDDEEIARQTGLAYSMVEGVMMGFSFSRVIEIDPDNFLHIPSQLNWKGGTWEIMILPTQEQVDEYQSKIDNTNQNC